MIMALALVVSCKTAKDTSAVNRVLASKPLLNKVKPAVDSLWPCSWDSTSEYHPGKIDSIPYEVYSPIFIDTLDRKRIVDSVIRVTDPQIDSSVANLQQIAIDSYNEGFKDAKAKFKDVKIPVPAPDTSIKKLRDNRELDICNEARQAAEDKLIQAQTKAEGWKKERNILFWLVLGLVAGLGASLFIKLKPKL